MKIIICGAGQVGESIAAHLSEEENDVTIIDQNQERIRKVLDHCDVSGVEGLASYPEVLQKAGIKEADNVGYAIKSSVLTTFIEAIPTKLSLPNSGRSISKLPLEDQIEILSNFVVLIKIN